MALKLVMCNPNFKNKNNLKNFSKFGLFLIIRIVLFKLIRLRINPLPKGLRINKNPNLQHNMDLSSVKKNH